MVRDRTAQLLFCGGTEPVALGDYGYDALYRTTSATGLQHPDIEANTHVTGFMQSLSDGLVILNPAFRDSFRDDTREVYRHVT